MVDRVFSKISVGFALFCVFIFLSYVNSESLIYFTGNNLRASVFSVIGAMGFSVVTITVMRKSRREWIKYVFPVFDALFMFCGLNIGHHRNVYELDLWFSVALALFVGFVTYSLGQINYDDHERQDRDSELRRQLNEKEAALNESRRILSETQGILNETLPDYEVTKQRLKETEAQLIESKRINDESNRNANESKRITDDSNRIIAELKQQLKETEAQLNESKRINDESFRNANESKRISDDSNRIVAELKQQLSDSKRKLADTQKRSADMESVLLDMVESSIRWEAWRAKKKKEDNLTPREVHVLTLEQKLNARQPVSVHEYMENKN